MSTSMQARCIWNKKTFKTKTLIELQLIWYSLQNFSPHNSPWYLRNNLINLCDRQIIREDAIIFLTHIPPWYKHKNKLPNHLDCARIRKLQVTQHFFPDSFCRGIERLFVKAKYSCTIFLCTIFLCRFVVVVVLW